MDSSQKSKTTALLLTALIALLLILFLVCGTFSFALPADREWPPERHSDILFEPVDDETFVEVYSSSGDNVNEAFDSDEFGPSDTDSSDPTQTSHDLNNLASTEGTSAPVTTSEQPSPVSHRNDKTAPGNTTPQETEAQAEARRRQQARQNIENRLNNRFSGAGNDAGSSSNTDGQSATGGSGGGNGLGMTASRDSRPSSTKLGTIVVAVSVLPDGSVRPGSARIDLGRCKGEAANDVSLKSRCLTAAYQCRFSRPAGESTTLPGFITFRWE